MAFEGLSEKLNATFKRLRGKGRLTEADVREGMREVRMALLEADVSYKVVKDFVASVTEKCVGADVLDSLTPAQQIIKIVNEELTALMGGTNARLTMASKGPTVVMMVGLQGAGKTTNGAKLAGLMRRQFGRRPLLAACDVYRPAAITQLQVVGKQLDIPVFEMGQIDPVTIAREAIKYAADHGNDMVFLDTAGRLHIDEALMDELKAVKAEVKPSEILLVVDAMTGQDAVNAARADAQFHLAIAEASHNAVLVQMMGSLFELVLGTVAQNRRLMFVHSEPGTLDRLTQQHHALMQAIIDGEPEQARAAISDHLSYVHQRLTQADADAARRQRLQRFSSTAESFS